MFGTRSVRVATLTLVLVRTNAHDLGASSALRRNGGKDGANGRRSLQDARPENENVMCLPPDCRNVTGTYANPGGGAAKWWAFVPSGAAACPAEGCPLFVAVDGTGDEFFDPPDQQTWMIHMARRGFVGVTMEYQAAFGEFGLCDQTGAGKILQVAGNFDLVQKARAIFDPTDEGSVVSQLCDGPEALANCDLGIAVQGVSQGSLILGQATNLDKRISAALLWAVGDVVQVLRGAPFFDESYQESVDSHIEDIPLPCMDSFQLPPPRMRLINGDGDRFFGRDAAGTILQHKHMVDHFYDCGDARDCLTKEAPSTVRDAYTGGTIADEGGYFIVDNSSHTGFFRCHPACEATGDCDNEDWDRCDEPSPIFANEAIYGGPAGYDWLARTARIPYTAPQGSDFDKISMELDLGHWRLRGSGSVVGFFVEWAASNGALGPRTRVAEGNVYNMTVSFSGEDVPADTIGFRLSASSKDGAFLDQLRVTTSEGAVFKGLFFGENDGGGWCISMDPNNTFFAVDCVGGQAFRCIDFCTGSTGEVENFHFCDNSGISMCLSNGKKSASAIK